MKLTLNKLFKRGASSRKEKTNEEKSEGGDKSGELIELIIQLRNKAKADKDYALSDQLRDELIKMQKKDILLKIFLIQKKYAKLLDHWELERNGPHAMKKI